MISPADAPPFSGRISFTVACTNPVENFSDSIPVSANSGMAAAINVTAGSLCTLEEVLPAAPAGYRWDTPTYTQPGVIAENETATASITNTLVKSASAAQPVPTLSGFALVCLSALMAFIAWSLGKRRHANGRH